MQIDAVSYGDRSEQAQSTRARIERERAQSSAPDLHASVVANTQSLIGALAPNAAETKRLNNLIASARAAAVQLVTQPVETAPTEKVKTVSELLDGVRYHARQTSQDTQAAEDIAENAAAAVRTTPLTAPQSSLPAVPQSPAPTVTEQETAPAPAPSVTPTPPEPSPPIAEAPGPAPTPEPQPPATAPAPSQPAPAPAQPAAPPTPPASSSSPGLGGVFGGLFGRR